MGTNVPGFSNFSAYWNHFVMNKLSHSTIRGKLCYQDTCTLVMERS